MRRTLVPTLVLFLGVLALAPFRAGAEESSASATTTTTTAATPSAPAAAFTGEVEVNIMNLNVTVLDANGHPITGLTPELFTVRDGGETVEITNFEEVRRGEQVTTRSVSSDAPLLPTPDGSGAAPAEIEHLTILFDNRTLERRARKRVIKSLEEFFEKNDNTDRRVMVAAINDDLDIVQPFSSDRDAVLTALDRVNHMDTRGEMLRNSKRLLQRDLASAQLTRSKVVFNPVAAGSTGGDTGGGGGGGGGGGQQRRTMPQATATDTDFPAVQGQQLLNQVNVIRYQEYDQVRQSLGRLDELTRSLSGVKGAKDVVWIGEDLTLRPALDIYEAYYERFKKWERDLNLQKPELWALDVELTEEFKYVAAGAQAAGTTLHVIDAANRDRDMATTDFGSTDVGSFTNIEGGSTGLSTGYNFSSARSMVEGSQYLADATGGDVFFNSRNFTNFLDSLDNRLGSYYSIGYRLPTKADGQLHTVTVELALDDAEVHHHQKILNRTAPQELVDRTLSRLRLDEGDNALEMAAALGDPEPADGDQTIREVRLNIPARNLVLLPTTEEHVGRLVVVLQSMTDDEQVFPPQVMEMVLRVPRDRLSPLTVTSAAVRLLMNDATRRVAVGVLDQASGTMATTAIEVP